MGSCLYAHGYGFACVGVGLHVCECGFACMRIWVCMYEGLGLHVCGFRFTRVPVHVHRGNPELTDAGYSR